MLANGSFWPNLALEAGLLKRPLLSSFQTIAVAPRNGSAAIDLLLSPEIYAARHLLPFAIEPLSWLRCYFKTWGEMVNWEAIAALVEGIGAVAVIGSLVYVASQIRLANRISVREARAALIDTVQAIYRLPLEHPQLAELNVKLQSADTAYTPEEADQARALAALWITFISKVNGTHESGLLPDIVFEVYLNNFLAQLERQPGLISFLSEAYKESSIGPGDFAAHDQIFALLPDYQRERTSRTRAQR